MKINFGNNAAIAPSLITVRKRVVKLTMVVIRPFAMEIGVTESDESEVDFCFIHPHDRIADPMT